MGINTPMTPTPSALPTTSAPPLIRAQSSLPALGRARPGQPDPAAEGAHRAAFGSRAGGAASAAEADQEEARQAELLALRQSRTGRPQQQRSWSYLATEGAPDRAGKGWK